MHGRGTKNMHSHRKSLGVALIAILLVQGAGFLLLADAKAQDEGRFGRATDGFSGKASSIREWGGEGTRNETLPHYEPPRYFNFSRLAIVIGVLFGGLLIYALYLNQ